MLPYIVVECPLIIPDTQHLYETTGCNQGLCDSTALASNTQNDIKVYFEKSFLSTPMEESSYCEGLSYERKQSIAQQ